jgi:alpha-mannosidase
MSLDQWARLQFARIDELVVAQSAPTGGWQVRVGQYYPEDYAWDGEYQPVRAGDFWGRPDGTAEFAGRVQVPAAMAGKAVWLQFFVGGEVIVWADGQMLDGIDPNRSRVLLTPAARAGQVFDLRLEAYTRSKPDDDRAIPARDIRGCVQRFNLPHLVVLDDEALALKYDLDILYGLAFGQRATEAVQSHLRSHVRGLLKRFPLYDSDLATLRQAVHQIRAYLYEHVFRDHSPFGHAGRLACVAHSHLDIAYHWKVVQTVQKNARTCLIQLRLMERYPELGYAHSQAWAYETLEQYYPELFEEVKQRITEGRWEIVGGLYVEPDCNLLSAESLARQVLYGQRYFRETFGLAVDNCWLPDVFGNTAILPQILKLGSIDYFVSNKMSTWNDTNLFPHNNFRWRGLDGSEVYACVPPVHFITWFEPDQVIESWDAFLDKDTCDESLHMFGFGDGGSGVTEGMLEHYQRLKRSPGVPRLRLTSGQEYLHTAFAQPERLAVWDGELYLEMHRGTFTTKGALKRENRRGEFLAQETETLCTLAALHNASYDSALDWPYPADALREAWKKLLLNQFHDILPGSHTEAVYDEAMDTYAQMRAVFETLCNQALDLLAPCADEDQVCVLNPFSDRRGGLAQFDVADGLDPANQALGDDEGDRYPLQKQVLPGGGERMITAVPSTPPLGACNLSIVRSRENRSSDELRATPSTLENRFFHSLFDGRRRLVRLVDKCRRREVVPVGAQANEWQLFEDKPGKYNAWDILPNYQDHSVPIPDWESAEVVEEGPLSVALRMRRTFGSSRAEQVIRLYADVPRIDFETWIDWQETERLLKVAFPLTVKARHYTTDTSAGGLERDNHQNTSWQQARFEVCTHKWTDLSEGLFGVALLSDCKYGVDVQGNVLRLSLLRAPIRPDPTSDRGEHRFTYSLYTHDGDWRRGGVVETAYDLNWPLVARRGRQAAQAFPPLTIDTPALKVQALKLAEDGSGDVVVRLVELYGSRGTASVQMGFPVKSAVLCNLLEQPLQQVDRAGDKIALTFQPYQILTLRTRHLDHE